MPWNIFPGRLISRLHYVLKACVLHTHPAMTEELKTKIWAEISSTSQELFQKAMSNLHSQ